MSDQSVARALLALAEQQRIANRIAFHQLTRALDHREQKALAEDIYRASPPTPKDEAEERDPWASDWPSSL